MLLSLTDHLRCTEPHAVSRLVARVDTLEARRMVSGVLGCPVCHAERTVVGGVIWWRGAPVSTSPLMDAGPGEEAVMRMGALLAFAESAAPYVLCGEAARTAIGLTALGAAAVVLLDPPDDRAAAFATIIRGAPIIPFVALSVRGIAVDASWSTDARLASCAGALAPGGRLVAPAAIVVPAGIRELARDAAEWVGEREATSAPVPLGRGRPAAG